MLLRTLSLVATTLITSTSFAYEEDYDPDTIFCLPLANGENGQGSTNSAIIPPFYTSGSAWLEVMVNNVGKRPINVHVKILDENGNQHVPTSGVTFGGNFSSSNNPIRQLDQTGWAALPVFNTGYVRIDDNSPGYHSGVITWQADACLDAPTVSVSINNSYHVTNSHRDASRSLTINGGNPF